jgi:hypothetical protein
LVAGGPFGRCRRAGRLGAADGIARRRLEGSRGCPPACMRPPPPDLI